MNAFTIALGSICVEPAQASDVDDVLTILHEAGEWLTAKGIDQWKPGRFTRDRAIAAIERGETYVARLGDVIVGTLRLQWSDEVLWGVRPDGAGYVHALAVKRAYAGHKIGVGLLRWAESQVVVTGRRFLRLDCMAANPTLRSYYLRHGFAFVGEVQKHNWSAALFEREAKAVKEFPG